jgi:hypothetical protein
VALEVVEPEAAHRLIDLDTLVLLFGMMLVVNDTICVALTPLGGVNSCVSPASHGQPAYTPRERGSWRMGILTDDVTAQLKEEFAQLVNPVRLAVFSQALAEPESEQVRRMVEELGALDSRISVESCNFVLDETRTMELAIARIPAVAILGAEKDHGIRFYGMPTGYEFGSLVDAILDVSSGDSGLAPETRAALAALDRPLHLQVFSTPT